MAVGESDWKTFKRIREAALERFSQRILDECAEIAADDSASAHERYLRTYRLMRDRDRELAAMFDDFSRSKAQMCLELMDAHGLLTASEIAEFSSDVQEALARLARWREEAADD